MLRKLYDRTMALSAHRHALWVLAVVSFAESSVFPIPPDVLLIPMVLAARGSAWRIALVCTVASVLGGFAGYGIGYFLFEAVGRPIVDFYGHGNQFAQIQARYNEWGAWIVFVAGFSPIPYKIFTIASGVTVLDPWVFVFASAISRGARFFLVAGLLWYFGEPIRAFIEKYLGWLTVLFVVLLFVGFAFVRFVL